MIIRCASSKLNWKYFFHYLGYVTLHNQVPFLTIVRQNGREGLQWEKILVWDGSLWRLRGCRGYLCFRRKIDSAMALDHTVGMWCVGMYTRSLKRHQKHPATELNKSSMPSGANLTCKKQKGVWESLKEPNWQPSTALLILFLSFSMINSPGTYFLSPNISCDSMKELTAVPKEFACGFYKMVYISDVPQCA